MPPICPLFNEALKTGVDTIIASPAYGNVPKIEQPFSEIGLPSPWTWRGFQRTTMTSRTWAVSSPLTLTPWTRAVFAALNPAVLIWITDYVAAAGSGTRDTQALHRIDPEIIKSEVICGGIYARSRKQRADESER